MIILPILRSEDLTIGQFDRGDGTDISVHRQKQGAGTGKGYGKYMRSAMMCHDGTGNSAAIVRELYGNCAGIVRGSMLRGIYGVR